ncbi:uncharacterized protein MELLADRAFT_65334 [Melampsora larici-populina 98AG31]|uniref:Secreted protein n=1 Tax=Melampsora larici-populina (strain 98AG31 / pathotype 3-4-7) TaxID=747676 RepID=F4RUY6_MELLP|nr:uncharacterized protein MELLADRAFT_65334 [Melampsora larici-populina 98AG31]EGG03777.1 hypothetical protein MELLADRAFT_65334 [Melampsora larici-populina 98AG31]
MFSQQRIVSSLKAALLFSVLFPENCSADLGTEIVDLSPRITPEVTFYIDSKIDFNQPTKIYKDDGESLYNVIPMPGTPGVITLQEDRSSDTSTSIQLNDIKCVSGAQWPPYFLEASAKGWTLQDATHQPKDFMSVYKGKSQATLPGEIQTTGLLQTTLAKISLPQSGPTTLPEGEYYTVNIIADRGHDPFVKWEDALALTLELIQYSRMCDHTQ